MSKKTFLYLRVSTLDQGVESQARALNEWCVRNNITDYETFTDHGISGAKESRPALDKMMERVKNHEAEQVIVFAFSRFARSTMHLLKSLELFKSHQTRFISVTEQIDTESSMGVAMFTIISCLAQLERSMIQERVKAGMRNAKLKGKIIGRQRKRNDSLIHSLLEAGLSFREVARIAKCSHGSVSASKKELLAKKAKLEKDKILELQNQIKQNSSTETFETMKSMNVSEDVVKQVRQKIENEARESVQSVMGHAGYETFD
ncbi:MAG: recombinase family protein [Bdellovibrionaceae bacterium]|nr:recombinase family protein [Pseudobdellovibrionaceae bacterium]